MRLSAGRPVSSKWPSASVVACGASCDRHKSSRIGSEKSVCQWLPGASTVADLYVQPATGLSLASNQPTANRLDGVQLIVQSTLSLGRIEMHPPEGEPVGQSHHIPRRTIAKRAKRPGLDVVKLKSASGIRSRFRQHIANFALIHVVAVADRGPLSREQLLPRPRGLPSGIHDLSHRRDARSRRRRFWLLSGTRGTRKPQQEETDPTERTRSHSTHPFVLFELQRNAPC